MNIKHRLQLVILLIILVILAGTLGYYAMFGGKYAIMDCLYMTVISITSVGYGEIIEITGNVPAEIFTMVLITFGMGIILYGLGAMTAILIEGELSGMLRKKKMEKAIGKLNKHIIVCGGGQTGLPVIMELVKNRESVVMIESDQGSIDRCLTFVEDLLYIQGDATEDENLLTAGIENAHGIAICLPSDKDNLYITMASRMLNGKVRIISTLTNVKLYPKLTKAGANSVVSPNTIGALRIASEMIRPTVVDFLDSMLRSKQGNLRIHQVVITQSTAAIGQTLGNSGFSERFGLLVLGAKKPGGEILFNPGAQLQIEPGLTLIVMGEVDNIASAQKNF
jgi:voltage-gated potassium channel